MEPSAPLEPKRVGSMVGVSVWDARNQPDRFVGYIGRRFSSGVAGIKLCRDPWSLSRLLVPPKKEHCSATSCSHIPDEASEPLRTGRHRVPPLRRGITLTEGLCPRNTKEVLQTRSVGYFWTDVAQITRARDRGSVATRGHESMRTDSRPSLHGLAREPGSVARPTSDALKRPNRRESGGAQSAACGSPPCRAYRP